MELQFNEQGGIVPPDVKALKRARAADLLTLPASLNGTNCSSCSFFRPGAPSGRPSKVGYCEHKFVDQPVTSRECCAFWTNSGVIRP